MAESRAYSCPQCGATLKLDPHSGMLTCEYCDGFFDVDSVERAMDEKRERAGEKAEAAAELPDSVPISQWDDFIAAGNHEQFDELVGYVCTNCGAQVVADKYTAATSCQYCGSSVVVDERVSGGMKPRFVIPFSVSAKDLPQRLTDFYRDRPLLPKDFFFNNQVGEVQGIYVPFWLFDGTVRGNGRYRGISVRTYPQGEYDVTETTHHASTRVGKLVFDGIPVDASQRIDDDLMDSLEPFDPAGLSDFKAAYLTGFVAQRFDLGPLEVFDRAVTRMTNTARDEFRSSVPYPITDEQESFSTEDESVSYVLLPVYLFNCEYQGKHYRYAVNGQTGKVVGEVPICPKRSLIEFLKGALMGVGVAAALMVAGAILLF